MEGYVFFKGMGTLPSIPYRKIITTYLALDLPFFTHLFDELLNE
jgi:hypothetical protein